MIFALEQMLSHMMSEGPSFSLCRSRAIFATRITHVSDLEVNAGSSELVSLPDLERTRTKLL